jgi:hypothetical protein
VRDNEGLGRDRHFVDRTIGEIDEFLGMSRHEVPVAADVARVCARGGIARRDCRRECRIRNRPTQSAIADTVKLVVPVRSRQPHLDADVGVWRRRQPCRDATKRRERPERGGRRRTGWSGRRESASLNRLGGEDRPARKRHVSEGVARDGSCRGDSSRVGSTERENGHNPRQRCDPHVFSPALVHGANGA